MPPTVHSASKAARLTEEGRERPQVVQAEFDDSIVGVAADALALGLIDGVPGELLDQERRQRDFVHDGGQVAGLVDAPPVGGVGPVEVLLHHQTEGPGLGPLFGRQMGAQVLLELEPQQVDAGLRIGNLLAVERHPRGLTVGAHGLFEIALEKNRPVGERSGRAN